MKEWRYLAKIARCGCEVWLRDYLQWKDHELGKKHRKNVKVWHRRCLYNGTPTGDNRYAGTPHWNNRDGPEENGIRDDPYGNRDDNLGGPKPLLGGPAQTAPGPSSEIASTGVAGSTMHYARPLFFVV